MFSQLHAHNLKEQPFYVISFAPVLPTHYQVTPQYGAIQQLILSILEAKVVHSKDIFEDLTFLKTELQQLKVKFIKLY